MTGFDHSNTKFPLIGSHRAVECADCHKPPNMERTLLHVNFSKVPQACSECHEDPHGRQFAARESDCVSCHNSNKWKPSLFDHEKTAFSLKGGHQDVACGACHKLMKDVDGKQVLFYKPTPLACADCHGSNIPKETEKSALRPLFPSREASITARFQAAEFRGNLPKTISWRGPQNSDHVSLNLTSRALTYLRCLDLINCRSCDSSGSQRAIRISEGISASNACEYLRQPGRVNSQLGSASGLVVSHPIG